MGIPGCEDGTPGRCGRPGAGLWWAEQGSGEPLVLLHGGLADARFFSRNVPALAERFHVYTPDARGHGHTPDRPGPITPELLVRDTAAFLASVVGGPAHLAGHSMGGCTALHVALRHPDLVRRLILISASIRAPGIRAPGIRAPGIRAPGIRAPGIRPPGIRPPGIRAPGIRAPGPGAPDSPWPGLDQVVRFLGPGYGEVSPDGEAHFPVVASKIVTMLTGAPALAQADLGGVSSRTLLMAGDEDAVSLDDTVALYNGIPDAELAIVPGTSHFLLREKPDLCNAIMLDFLTGAPVPAVPPVRRAGERSSRLP